MFGAEAFAWPYPASAFPITLGAAIPGVGRTTVVSPQGRVSASAHLAFVGVAVGAGRAAVSASPGHVVAVPSLGAAAAVASSGHADASSSFGAVEADGTGGHAEATGPNDSGGAAVASSGKGRASHQP